MKRNEQDGILEFINRKKKEREGTEKNQCKILHIGFAHIYGQ
jgi:hypothetical protein